MKLRQQTTEHARKLPPLILHPFSDAASPEKLLESSRASLILQGLIPPELSTLEQLDDILLDGRFCELRMLYYIGKDLTRWIEQCMGVIEREPERQPHGVCWQSFAAMVVEDPPQPVREKLKIWGVNDAHRLFARGLGLNAVFAEVPDRLLLTRDFVRNYHRYADEMYSAKQSEAAFTPAKPADFDFELYASGEYSRLLERQWADGE